MTEPSPLTLDVAQEILPADDSYEALDGLRQAFVDAMRQVGADLARVVSYPVPAEVKTTLNLAFDLYLDLERADEIEERNRPRLEHPGFLPGGETIEVLNE
ncbi:MAG: hypothetical protein C4575_09320 [Desulforudis sp.]|nr:MAG: hypothetical protein C4575_09320 [Desulforudis sp.]